MAARGCGLLVLAFEHWLGVVLGRAKHAYARDGSAGWTRQSSQILVCQIKSRFPGEAALGLEFADGPESERQDLNLRPPLPQSGALPSCATPRQNEVITAPNPAPGPGFDLASPCGASVSPGVSRPAGSGAIAAVLGVEPSVGRGAGLRSPGCVGPWPALAVLPAPWRLVAAPAPGARPRP